MVGREFWSHPPPHQLCSSRYNNAPSASQRIGHGRENAKQYLRDHPEMAAEIEQTIRAEAGVGGKGIDLLDEDPTPVE